MNLVSVKAPSARVTTAGQAIELLDASLGIVVANQLLQVVAYQLIETLTESVSLLSGACDKLLID
jgi:hypothetical protein